MKFLKGLGRAIWAIVFLLIAIVAIIVFLVVGPQFTSYVGSEGANMTGALTVFSLSPFSFIFGGETTVTTSVQAYLNGNTVGDPVTATITTTLNFDYFSLISLILFVVAIVLFIVFMSKKSMLAISAFLFLICCVLGAIYSVTFPMINKDFVETLGSVATLVPTGAIIYSICSGLLFILTLIKAAVASK